jgi:hypothetical protein
VAIEYVPYKVCEVCWALVHETHKEDHLRWHKNLSNIPKTHV